MRGIGLDKERIISVLKPFAKAAHCFEEENDALHLTLKSWGVKNKAYFSVGELRAARQLLQELDK